jgi:hypothetical protein
LKSQWGNQAGIRALEEKLSLLAKYGGPYVFSSGLHWRRKKAAESDQSKYEETKVDAEQELPQKFVVKRSIPRDRKFVSQSVAVVMITLVALLS